MDVFKIRQAYEEGKAEHLYSVEFPDGGDYDVYFLGYKYYLVESNFERIVNVEVSPGAMTDFILLHRGYKIR